MSKTLILVLCLLLLSAGGCAPYANAKISIEPVFQDPEGDLHFTDVAISKGKLEQNYDAWGANLYPAGTPCILITGKIVNSSDRDWWVAYSAAGYDKDNNSIAKTLDTGPITGVARTYIPAQTSENFTLHLTMAKDIVQFTITSQKSDIIPP